MEKTHYPMARTGLVNQMSIIPGVRYWLHDENQWYRELTSAEKDRLPANAEFLDDDCVWVLDPEAGSDVGELGGYEYRLPCDPPDPDGVGGGYRRLEHDRLRAGDQFDVHGSGSGWQTITPSDCFIGRVAEAVLGPSIWRARRSITQWPERLESTNANGTDDTGCAGVSTLCVDSRKSGNLGVVSDIAQHRKDKIGATEVRAEGRNGCGIRSGNGDTNNRDRNFRGACEDPGASCGFRPGNDGADRNGTGPEAGGVNPGRGWRNLQKKEL